MPSEPGRLLGMVADLVSEWEERWGRFEPHPAGLASPRALDDVLRALAARLEDNYPFFHPHFAGQMLKPPHPVAAAGYAAAMLINPNNHALDGGPATAALEREVVADLAAMFRLPEPTLGHLTSSGTIANLEALFVARELHPGKAIAHSVAAHYTHSRMAHVLGVETRPVATDDRGRIDIDALESELRSGEIGTVVLTTGTTGIGAVDPVDEVLALRERYRFRVHVDAAYGGFFSILAWADQPLVTSAPFRAIAECDSVVVDPHKHGLQPYGCGAVLFADPSVGRFYQHDSPYTYFTSDELHLGEISLECSRAGAAAAALWATLELFPLTPDGLGAVLAAGRRAALDWTGRLLASDVLEPLHQPELDIVTFFPSEAQSASAVDRLSQDLFDALAAAEDPIFLSLLRASAGEISRRRPQVAEDQATARVLRSVMMKPEHELVVDELHERAEGAARLLATLREGEDD
jgi:glutamate/tyrosine decarboxylase-like PLP-dependent enzyme